MRTCRNCGRSDPECGFYEGETRCRDCRRRASRASYAKGRGHPDLGGDYRRPPRPHGDAHREASYRYMGYRLTVPQYNELLARQGGRCAICRRLAGEFTRRLHVDHDHETGQVRGLLCHHCNLLLGHAKDDPTILVAAIAYLSRKEN